MTVIENINIAYVSQDLSLLSSADADGTKDLRYLSVFAIGCMILPLREDRRNCLFNGWVNSFRIVLAFFTAWSSYRQSICVSVLFTIFSDFLEFLMTLVVYKLLRNLFKMSSTHRVFMLSVSIYFKKYETANNSTYMFRSNPTLTISIHLP